MEQSAASALTPISPRGFPHGRFGLTGGRRVVSGISRCTARSQRGWLRSLRSLSVSSTSRSENDESGIAAVAIAASDAPGWSASRSHREDSVEVRSGFR